MTLGAGFGGWRIMVFDDRAGRWGADVNREDGVRMSSTPPPARRQAAGSVDFAMRYDRWYRVIATLMWIGPKRTRIRLDDADGVLRVRHGWAFRLDAPYSVIQSAELVTGRPLAWGVHCTGDKWMVNGARDGIVEIKFSPAIALDKVPMAFAPIRGLWVSVVDEGSFAAALNARIALVD